MAGIRQLDKDKAEARQIFSARRKMLSESERREFDAAICEKWKEGQKR